ncbi:MULTISPECIES: EAL domain-containing protein [unclassified Paenibacillus]|uniref:EAL domain-containing protein n=1 Tax=unclassified Paenibacillus TaxID=185978 RepID=UPI00020D7627|nr:MULTISPECIES: EAL domain-containing protein [unclassified Paenibacillus]EGL15057.1 cyclic diguanylate phosphodiesterase (EAL) domain protein [Paenibacillus sp. HGF7]EPD80467.1 hypothetical protein HMPREF1207_05682 [Paenibacillus sp. HGH0039]
MNVIETKFQPIIDVLNNTTLGYESTIKGRNGDTAQNLFSQAADHNFVLDLDRHAIELSFRDGQSLLQDNEYLFVNLHPKTLEKGLEQLSKFPTENVIWEITEQTSITSTIRRQIEILCSMGFQFALDDYGTRNSNLDMLLHDWLDPKFIKLDKEFTASLEFPRTSSIITSLVSLCEDTGIGLIVEGVESEKQLLQLRELGVRYMQGFHLGYPRPAKEVRLRN